MHCELDTLVRIGGEAIRVAENSIGDKTTQLGTRLYPMLSASTGTIRAQQRTARRQGFIPGDQRNGIVLRRKLAIATTYLRVKVTLLHIAKTGRGVTDMAGIPRPVLDRMIDLRPIWFVLGTFNDVLIGISHRNRATECVGVDALNDRLRGNGWCRTEPDADTVFC
ncbi:hypothetical protein [Lysobacter sp. CA199]|uniref:hypothetical protein n=1 Tax=Lysobacter sp. CA199 TaxID=3455608 RepID=UPI003F8D5A60